MPAKKKNTDAPATKKDLQQLEESTKKEILQLEARFDNKIESLRNELKAEIKGSKNEVLNSNDEILKKLDDMRIEKLMLISRNREHTETINNHEERIVRLEHKVLV